MKKLIVAAAVLGSAAIPGVVAAQHRADDKPAQQATHTSRQQHQETETHRSSGHNAAQVSATQQTTDDSHNGVRASSHSDDVSAPTTRPEGSVSLATAQRTAQAVFPNKSIVKSELETEHGSLVYSFRFSDDSRVDVLADTGEVNRTNDGGAAENRDDHDDEHDDSGSGSRNSGHGSDD